MQFRVTVSWFPAKSFGMDPVEDLAVAQHADS